MKKQFAATITIVLACSFTSTADAQRNQNRGRRGGPANQENFQNLQGQQQMAGGTAMNRNANQNGQSVGQLAQMLLANFDADRSGELSQIELQNALTALRQMMQNQTGQRNGRDPQNAFQGQQNQADQQRGNRPPPPPPSQRVQANTRRNR